MTANPEANRNSLLLQDIPMKDHLLRVLDWEINRIDEQDKQPGWTIWAIYGALGAICWTLLEQIASPQLTLNHALLYFLIAYIVLDLSEHLNSLLKFQATNGKSLQRYFATNILAANRYQMIFDITMAIIVLRISSHYASPVSFFARYSLNLYYGLTILGSLAAIVTSYIKWPLPVPNPKTNIRWTIPVIQGIFLVIPLVSYAYSFSVDEVKLIDVKVAALITAMVFLISRLIEKKTLNPLYLSLVGIRRKLAFDELSLDEAVKQAEIAMAGMRIGDVFQEDIKNILNNIEKISRKEDEIESRIRTLHAEWPQKLCDLNGEQQKKILDEIKSWVGKNKELKRLVDENAEAVKSFKNKIKIIETYLKHQPPEIEEIMKMLMRAESDSKERMIRYIKTFVEFTKMAEQPCPKREDLKKTLSESPPDKSVERA